MSRRAIRAARFGYAATIICALAFFGCRQSAQKDTMNGAETRRAETAVSVPTVPSTVAAPASPNGPTAASPTSVPARGRSDSILGRDRALAPRTGLDANGRRVPIDTLPTAAPKRP